MSRTFRFDTETFPIRPGLAIPRMVCLQHAFDQDHLGIEGPIKITLRDRALDTLAEAYSDPDCLVEGHNSAYDHAVVANAHPELLPLVFRALGNKRGRDTQHRETLIEIRNGTLQENSKRKGWFSLAGVASRRLGVTMDKGEESWRTRYALLDGVPVDQWPTEAYQYAYDDVRYLRGVSKAQNAVYAPPDEWLQVGAAFVLHLGAAWGVRTDPVQLEKVTVDLTTRRDAAEAILDRAGFFRDGAVDQAKVREAVERACAEAGKPVPRTDKGAVKYDADTCEKLAPYDPALMALSERTTTNKFLKTYIEPMRLGVRTAMGSRPNVLVASGRTSWSGSALTETNPWWPEPPEGYEYAPAEHTIGTNLQNFPQVKGIRDCIVPRPGRWLWSVDWSSLELRTLAQVVLWIVGRSKMADRYRVDADYDPHTEVAASLMGISYEAGLALKKTGDKRFKEHRQIGKCLNFGFPGGLGAKTFVHFAEASYGVKVTESEAKELKAKWLRTFPEMQDYFDYISFLAETGRPYRQFVSDRLRGGIGFCDGCNTGFQGLGGDAAKVAAMAVSQACYVEPTSPLFGSRLLVLVHDELIGESDIDKAPEACLEVQRLMNLALSKLTPDIPPGAEPTLMTRWIKEAAPKYGPDGRLTAWDL